MTVTFSVLPTGSYPSGTLPPLHKPLRFDAAALSRMRSAFDGDLHAIHFPPYPPVQIAHNEQHIQRKLPRTRGCLKGLPVEFPIRHLRLTWKQMFDAWFGSLLNQLCLIRRP